MKREFSVAAICIVLAGCSSNPPTAPNDPSSTPDLQPVVLVNSTWEAANGPMPMADGHSFEIARFMLPDSTSRPIVNVTVEHSNMHVFADNVALLDPTGEFADNAALSDQQVTNFYSEGTATLTGNHYMAGNWTVVYRNDGLNPTETMAGTVVVTAFYP